MRVTWAEVRITNETRKASESCAMIIRRNIAFKLRVYGKDGNIFQIRLRTTFNGKRFDIKTGCQIPSMEQLKKKFEERIKGVVPRKPEETRVQKPTEMGFFKAFDLFVVECGEKNAWMTATFQKWAALRKDILNIKLHFSTVFEGIFFPISKIRNF